jgi:hypothetical protein
VSAAPKPDPDPAAAPDPRPRPQYGEYATPQEVANARGIPLDRGANEHVERLAAPIPPAHPASKKSASRSPRLGHAPALSGRPISVRPSGQVTPLATVLLLVFGIWNTVTAIPTFLDLDRALSQGFETLGYGTIIFGSAARVVGIVMLVFSFLVLIAVVWLSLLRIRAGRPSLWVPLAGGAIWALGYLVAMIVVVVNTPGMAAVMQNHS